jgi:hypothetical protein
MKNQLYTNIQILTLFELVLELGSLYKNAIITAITFADK